MPFQLPPLPSFQVQTPDFTQKALEGAQLRNMLSEESLRRALAPSQVQQAQAQAQQAQTASTLSQMQLESNKKMMDLVAGGLLDKFTGKNSGAPEGSAFDATGATSEFARQGVMLEVAQPLIQHFQNIDKTTSEIAKNYGAAATDFLNNRAKAHSQLAGSLDDALSSKNPAGIIPSIVARYLRDPQGLSPDEINGLRSLQGLSGDALVKTAGLMSSVLNLGAEMDRHHAETAKTLAEAQKAQTEAVTAQQNVIGPSGMSPEQQADVKKVTAIRKATLPFDLAKTRAEEAIRDGDPAAAAQLLVNGDVAPSQLISSRKPAFAQQAFTAAKQLNPNWNSQAAEGYFTTAKSPTNVQFFGSAKSLTDQGGTLDQLETAYKNLPNGRIPALNKLSDWTAAASGGGSTAGFAQTALGVADDYAKVMGGGQGSDTSRKEVLDSFARSSSPQQMAAAIAAARQAVDSQMSSRIGQNPVMKSMYGQGLLVHVKDPQGGDHIFRTQQQADAFKKAAGIQ